ncbi:MAG: DUF4349 domain-containing protein [Dehalococcoidia bacterium]
MRARLLHTRLLHTDSTARRSVAHRWRLVAVAAFALLAATLVACGGSDDSDDAAPSGAMTSQGTSAGAPAFGGAGDGARDASGEVGVAEESANFGAVAPAPDGPSSQPIADVLGRQVIRNGSVQLTVESVAETFDDIRGVVDQAGGFIASSSFSGREESQRARMTLRIPADRLDQVIADLRNMAIEVDSVETSSQDVTEEFTDLEASLRNLRAVEQQYLTLLGETDDIGEILQVQDRLTGVRYEIERVQGRLNLLENQTSLATLEVALYPEDVPLVEEPASDGFGDRVAEAWASSLDFVAAVGTGLAVALVWSWWLIPFLVVLAVLARRYGGRIPAGRASADGGRVDTPGGAA